jgi:tRNA pseudouridine38-40 synthase
VGDQVIIRVEARSFLYHQVRNIVGTLVLVGSGKKPPSFVGEVLAQKDRKKAGPTASPEGLYLSFVKYEKM